MSWILWSAGYLLCRGSKKRGMVYQQTFIIRTARWPFAKLYDRETPIIAAGLLDDRVLPFFEEHEIVVSRMLTDWGRSTVRAMAMNMGRTWN
jgi:hypothetical protein